MKCINGNARMSADGDLANALGRITADCVMPIDHDLFFPPNECEEDCSMIAGDTLTVINKDGHFALNGLSHP